VGDLAAALPGPWVPLKGRGCAVVEVSPDRPLCVVYEMTLDFV
jgi:hypothetical protein